MHNLMCFNAADGVCTHLVRPFMLFIKDSYVNFMQSCNHTSEPLNRLFQMTSKFLNQNIEYDIIGACS